MLGGIWERKNMSLNPESGHYYKLNPESAVRMKFESRIPGPALTRPYIGQDSFTMG